MASISSGLPLETRLQIAEDQITSGMTIKAFAEKSGYPASMLGYWVKLFREKNNLTPERKPKKQEAVLVPKEQKTELAVDNLSDAKSEIASLKFINDELHGKLDDARLKIKALQNVIVLLGHQVGDD